MVAMTSPEGESHDIPKAGVQALVELGWTQVERPKSRPAAKPKS